ncbi:DNA replication protein Orc8 [Halococcus dombrowskii]|uniref:ORC1-type DNA replication protein n=2 Tax=Halococcus dombrowskii TaxID=179637 RepID=A0AAV3SBW3_HALDO
MLIQSFTTVPYHVHFIENGLIEGSVIADTPRPPLIKKHGQKTSQTMKTFQTGGLSFRVTTDLHMDGSGPSEPGGQPTQQSGLRDFSTSSQVLADGDVFQGDKIQPETMPERESELGEIHSAIEPAARGENPRNLFIYGKPGQGKTAAVRLKREQFSQFADREDLDVTITYIECNSANKSYHVLTTALKKLKELNNKPRGRTIDNLYSAVFDYMNSHGGTYIYVLDEIDRIKDDDEEDDLNILYKLPRAYSSEDLDDDIGCSVIGISNDRRFKSNLSPRIKDALYDTEVDFVPYTREDLRTILYRRAAKGLNDTEVIYEDGETAGLRSSVISESVIEACAESAERERGSARQAIDLLGQAATIAHDERDDEVSISHVKNAQQEVNKNYIKNMLNDHTSDDLLALCGVLYLESRAKTPARTNQIHEHYTTYAESVGDIPLVQRRMRDRLQDLSLTGVINMVKVVGGQRGGARWEVELAIPLDETVDILLNDDSYAEHYERIAEEIASEL